MHSPGFAVCRVPPIGDGAAILAVNRPSIPPLSPENPIPLSATALRLWSGKSPLGALWPLAL